MDELEATGGVADPLLGEPNPLMGGGAGQGGDQGDAGTDDGSPVDPKADPKRVEFWQSRADKFRAQVEAYSPVIEYLNANPDAIELLQKHQSGQLSASAPAGGPKVNDEPQKPKAPERPSNFDAVAAHSDPTSASYQYQRAVEQYQLDMLNFITAKEEFREKKERERMAAEQQQRLLRSQMSQAQAMLQTQYGYTPEEAIDFIQVMNDPKVYTLENLARLHRMLRGKNGAAKPTPKKPASAFGPASPAVVGGSTEQQLDEDGELNSAMAAYSSLRKQR